MKRILITVICCFSLFQFPTRALASNLEKDVAYQIFVRSFSDSNSDHIGDLKGIEARLPYLKQLGVSLIILTPLYESDFYHNYFAKDFKKIDPRFGKEVDFFDLVRAAHKAGIKIVIDVEIQYVAEGHPWLETTYNHPGASDSDKIAYLDASNQHWTTGFWNNESATGYDGRSLKIAMSDVYKARAYHEDLFKYWMDPHGDHSLRDGIDGLRIDHMQDDLDSKGRLTHLFAGFWAPVLKDLRALNPKAVFIGEQAEWSEFGTDWFEKTTVEGVFGFKLHEAILSFNKSKLEAAIREKLTMTPKGASVLDFVELHDVNRFATEVKSDPGRLRVGAALAILLKGTPLIYYGQEIGMTGAHRDYGTTDGNDIGQREAMRWQADASAKGTADWYRNSGPWWDASSLKDPKAPNVADQEKDQASLLNTYRRLIALRQSTSALRTGSLRLVKTCSTEAIAFVRQKAQSRVRVTINLSDKAQTMCLILGHAEARLAPYEIRIEKKGRRIRL